LHQLVFKEVDKLINLKQQQFKPEMLIIPFMMLKEVKIPL